MSNTAAAPSVSGDAGFDFGTESPALPPLDDASLLADPLGDPLGTGGQESGSATVALTPQNPIPSATEDSPTRTAFGPGDGELRMADDLMVDAPLDPCPLPPNEVFMRLGR